MLNLKALFGKRRGDVPPALDAPDYTPVACIQDLPPGTAKVFTLRGREVGIFNVEGRYHAASNICPHQYRPIGVAEFQGNRLTCLWHSFEFDVETGECAAAPQFRLQKFPVRVVGDDILVALDSPQTEHPKPCADSLGVLPNTVVFDLED